ncbi:acetyltransferase [Terriglobus sp. TAA 43]|uniref:acetyltransferase n=1 Tax=Terriglobus sp. TAA 43 TaxID=278961 RepID=UPI00064889D6|nr:acetyltransferase [Terriglobus sp. TAA 43]
MPREAAYVATDHIDESEHADPYLRPAFTLHNRVMRVLWGVVWLLLYRPSPRPMHGWRSFLLRLFGATMGSNCHFYPKSKIWAPWNLFCADQVTAADGVEIYNAAPMHFGSHAIVSQDAYLCGATHDYNSAAFPLLAYEMHFGAYSWVCARAIVGPGANMGEGAVLGLGSVATRSLDPWTVHAGSPARMVKERKRTHGVTPA